MLSDKEKEELENAVLMYNLHPKFLDDSKYAESFLYAVKVGTPLFILKERNYSALDDKLEIANVILCLEYDGKDIGNLKKKEKTLLNALFEYVGVRTLKERVDQTVN